MIFTNELGHSICYKIAYVPSEDSDQSVHLHRLIRVFNVHLKMLLDPWLPTECPVKTDYAAQMCKSLMGTHALS